MNDRPSDDFTTWRFLVVDDEPYTLRMVEKTLANMGVENVEVASSGEQALAFLADDDRRPDLMLLDLRMPEMSGQQVLARMEADDLHCRVILLSGANEESLVIAQELSKVRGIDILGYIVKPLNEASLRSIIDGR